MDESDKHKFSVVEGEIEQLCKSVFKEILYGLYAELDQEQEKIDSMPLKEKIDMINRFDILKRHK